MTKALHYLSVTLLISLLSCGDAKQSETKESESVGNITEIDNSSHHIPELSRVFEAHGGFDTWSKLKTLTYDLGEQSTLVELQNRYTRIVSEERTIGFDGQQVWVNPPGEDDDRYRMRYNLMFYFFAFPFVVGDPGINYEVMEPVDLLGKNYNTVKVSYNSGVGDAPNDSYVVCSDPETNQMEWLLYTATFGGDPKEKYSLIKYEGWQEYGGIKLPTRLQWYQYEDGVVGDPRGNGADFDNIRVSTEYPSPASFKAPEGANVLTD